MPLSYFVVFTDIKNDIIVHIIKESCFNVRLQLFYDQCCTKYKFTKYVSIKFVQNEFNCNHFCSAPQRGVTHSRYD